MSDVYILLVDTQSNIHFRVLELLTNLKKFCPKTECSKTQRQNDCLAKHLHRMGFLEIPKYIMLEEDVIPNKSLLSKYKNFFLYLYLFLMWW